MSQTLSQKKKNGRAYILAGIIFVLLAIFFFMQLSELEKTGGSISINAIVAILYNKFGKEITCGLMVLLGLVLCAKGSSDLKSIKKETMHNDIDRK